MSPQRWLARYLVEIIAAMFAALGVVEIWVAPTSGSKLVTIPAALLSTLPLLLRRRFPLAAPIVVFAAVAAIAAAWPDDLKHGATLPFFALLLAFWIVGTENELHQAIAGVAAGPAIVVVGALITTFNEALSDLLGVSRVVFAMARGGDFPQVLGRVGKDSPGSAALLQGSTGAGAHGNAGRRGRVLLDRRHAGADEADDPVCFDAASA